MTTMAAKRARGRPFKISPEHRAAVFDAFNHLLRSEPGIALTEAHRRVATRYGVGEKTVREIVAEFEGLAAGIRTDLGPPVAGTDPWWDWWNEYLRQSVAPELAPGPLPATEEERVQRAEFQRQFLATPEKVITSPASPWGPAEVTQKYRFVTSDANLAKRIEKRRRRGK